MTLTAWVNSTATNTAGYIAMRSRITAQTGSYRLMLLQGRVVAVYAQNNTHVVSVQDDLVVADGLWHHLAMIADAAGMRLYIDGNLRGSRTWFGTGGPLAATEPLVFGSYPGNTNLCFEGKLDEFALWNRSLSQDELRSGLFRGLTGDEAGLVAYWRMDEGSRDTLVDATGHGHHALLIGAPEWAASSLPQVPEAPRTSPAVATKPAEDVRLNGATLHSTIDARYQLATAWFEWGVGTNFDHRTDSAAVSGAVPVPFQATVENLDPGVTYFYRAAASNAAGLTLGEPVWFIPGLSPDVTTLAPKSVMATGTNARAILCAEVNPGWIPTVAWFVWGPNIFCRNTTRPWNVGASGQSVKFSQNITELPAGETYHYRLVSSNLLGVTIGSEQTFTPPGIVLSGPKMVTRPPAIPYVDPGAFVVRPIQTISVSGSHGLALTYDGRLFSWPMGTTVSDGSGEQIPSDLRNVIAIDTGFDCTAALRSDGKEFRWGTCDTDWASIPEPLPGHHLQKNESVRGFLDQLAAPVLSLTNVVAFEEDRQFVIALTEDGLVHGTEWVPDGITNAVAVDRSYDGYYALQRNGMLHDWSRDWTTAVDLSFLAAAPSVHGDVNVDRSGVYFIHYTATNASGHWAKDTREVIIVPHTRGIWDLDWEVSLALRRSYESIYDPQLQLKMDTIQSALREATWYEVWSEDWTRLDPLNGVPAIESLKQAVTNIVALYSWPGLNVWQLRRAVSNSVEILRFAAVIALQDAARRGVDVDKIERIMQTILAGDSFAANEPLVALAHYKTAWHHAVALNLHTAIRRDGNSVIIKFPAVPGAAYALETSTGLRDWYVLDALRADDTGTAEFIQPASNNGRFYRIWVMDSEPRFR